MNLGSVIVLFSVLAFINAAPTDRPEENEGDLIQTEEQAPVDQATERAEENFVKREDGQSSSEEGSSEEESPEEENAFKRDDTEILAEESSSEESSSEEEVLKRDDEQVTQNLTVESSSEESSSEENVLKRDDELAAEILPEHPEEHFNLEPINPDSINENVFNE